MRNAKVTNENGYTILRCDFNDGTRKNEKKNTFNAQ